MPIEELSCGVVKWFSMINGYGIIEDAFSQKEVFLHFKSWIDKNSIENINDKKILVYTSEFSHNKLSAKQCRYFNYSINDFKLFCNLTIEKNDSLFIVDKNNNKIQLYKLIDINNALITNFYESISLKFKHIKDDIFIEYFDEFKRLFGEYLICNSFYTSELLKRFNNSSDTNFKLSLLNNGYLSYHDVNLEFVLNHYNFTINLFNKIKNHKEINNYIVEIMKITQNREIQKELIFLSIKNNIENTCEMIVSFVNKLKEDEFIEMIKSIINESKINNILCDFDFLIARYLETKNSKKLKFDAYRNDLINLSEDDLIKNFIYVIDKNEFIKFESTFRDHNLLVSSILKKNSNQELLKYVIENFEKYNIEDYRIFFNLGVERLSWLSEENQVLYLKKLFYLKYLKKCDFSRDELNNLLDENVFKKATKNNCIDFSTYLVIDLICKFDEQNGFIAQHELIKSVLNYLQNNKMQRVTIDNYLDHCDGRTIEKLPPNDKIIEKKEFTMSNGNKNHYLKIRFPYDEDLVNAIEDIPERQYYPNLQSWGIPLDRIKEVIEFKRKYQFTIDLGDGKLYENNQDLIEFRKNYDDKPSHFCDGLESQKLSNSGKIFWWCDQSLCFQSNIVIHENWKEYTLFNFMKIFDLNLEEKKSDGTVFKIGLYSRFITLLNRFNKLLEKMYCNECDHVLYPIESSNYNAYSVTRFICKNEKCNSKNNIVYLNHCLNGKCKEIIDSRISKKCPNGRYICLKCGSCCSTNSFQRTQQNLNITGGSELEILQNLLINNKSGHLEKAEYFCYKCGQWMMEYSKNLYKCNDCHVTYDISRYSNILAQQINRNLRPTNYPTNQNEIEIQMKAILLNEKEKLKKLGKTKGQIFGILFNKNVVIDGNDYSLKNLNNKQLNNQIFD